METIRERLRDWAINMLKQPIVSHQPADRHIDEIDIRFRPRSEWVRGGFECLSVAREIRDALKPDDTVCMTFHLASEGERMRGLCPARVTDMARELGCIPPELVWLRGEQEVRRTASEVATGTELLNWGQPLDQVRVFYHEWERSTEAGAELLRNIWVVSPGNDADWAAR